MSKSLYDILEVSRDASQDDIKKSYKRLSKLHHPDMNGGSKESEEKFKEISNAYEVLSDDGKRREYDTFGQTRSAASGRHQGHGFGMDDIFSQFGDIFGRSQNRNTPRTPRGNDLRVQLSINLEDIIKGCTKKLKYKRQTSCDPCGGKGGSETKPCQTCLGRGQRTMTQQTPFGTISQTFPCSYCNGSGVTIVNVCKVCRGDGTNLTEEVIDVELPKGVVEGMALTMEGRGNHVRGGIPGDLQILIHEIPHTKFVRKGKDLYCDEWITISEAVLGKKIRIETLVGNYELTIPAGVESGRVFAMSGLGIPDLNQNGQIVGNGMLNVRVNVTIPKTLTSEQKIIFEKLREFEN